MIRPVVRPAFAAVRKTWWRIPSPSPSPPSFTSHPPASGPFLPLPARGLGTVRWRPVSPHDITHLLAPLHQEIERRIGRHTHRKRDARGIGIHLLGWRRFLPSWLRRGWRRVRGRLHQLRDGPAREVLGWGGHGRLGSPTSTAPEQAGPAQAQTTLLQPKALSAPA